MGWDSRQLPNTATSITAILINSQMGGLGFETDGKRDNVNNSNIGKRSNRWIWIRDRPVNPRENALILDLVLVLDLVLCDFDLVIVLVP